MTKDILLEGYGRQYELAVQLARSGWNIKGYCLDYRSKWKKETIHSGGVEWHSYSAPSLWLKWKRDISRSVRSWKPHVVLGCSDPLHITAAARVSTRGGVRFVVDLHDNLDSKGLMMLPGVRRRVEKAIKRADLISCVSDPLGDMVRDQYSPSGNVIVLENAIPDIFERGPGSDRLRSRNRYGFREDDQVIGIAGSLYLKRGIETVLTGFRILREDNPRLVLALAGPADKGQKFEEEGVHYFGNLAWDMMPEFLSTLDIGIVPNIRPVFADYCYPQKAVEMCSLSIPIVAANFGVMKAFANGHEEILYRPDVPADLARAVEYQLQNRVVLDVVVNTWQEQAHKMHASLCKLVH